MDDINWYCKRLVDDPAFTLDDSDVIPFQMDGKCGYADYYTKEILVSPTWDVALPFCGKQAIIINGASLDDFLPMDSFCSWMPHWAEDDKKIKVGIIDKTGKIMLPVQYGNIATFNNNMAVVKQNNNWGMLDYNFNIIIPFEYDHIVLCERLAFVVKNDKWGVVSHNGDMIVDCELNERPYVPHYERVYNGSYFLTRKGRKFGVLCNDGRLITYPTMLKREAQFLINKLEGRM